MELMKAMQKSLLTICLLIANATFGQTNESPNKLALNIIPVSPEAAAFQKYSYYPVSPSSGVTGVDIPLYMVTQGALSHAVTLSYNTGGIRVDERATSVGLGWLLNAGGAIVRTEQGLPDELPQRGYLATRQQLPAANNPNINQVPTKQFFDFCYDIAAVERPIDMQPDIFTYNFAGRSGSFYFSTSGDIVSEGIEALKIEPYNNFKAFRITDESGIVYQFEMKQQLDEYNNVSKLISGYNYSFDLSGSSDIVFCEQIFHVNRTTGTIGSPIREENNKTNAWFLTSIIHPNKQDTIYFDYESMSYNYMISQGQTLEYIYTPIIGGGLPGVNPLPPGIYESSCYATSSEPLLSRIRFANGQIILNYIADRTDFVASPRPKRLSSVICQSAAGKIVQRIELDNNHYFEANFDNSGKPSFENKRLKLNKIIFKSPNGNNDNAYEFAYRETELPSISSYAQDYWGYFNRKYNQNLIPKLTLPSGQSGTLTIGDADRRPDEDAMKAFILEKVYYPTGGLTTFEYSAHKTRSTPTGNKSTIIGGLRTDKVLLYPDRRDLSKYTVKRYQYSYRDSINVGRLMTNKCAEMNLGYKRYEINAGCYAEYITINSAPVYDIRLPGYAAAFYDKVTEFEEDAAGVNNGYKVSIFSQPGNFTRYFSTRLPYWPNSANYSPSGIGGFVYDYYDQEQKNLLGSGYDNIYFNPIKFSYPINARPLLIYEETYNKQGVLLSSVQRNYTERSLSNQHVVGFSVTSAVNNYEASLIPEALKTPKGRYYNPGRFNYFLYEIPLGKNMLVKETKSELTPEGYFGTTTDYEYEDTNGFLRKTKTTNSAKKEMSAEYWYVFDYSTSLPVIDSLSRKHILAAKILETSRVSGKLINSTVTDYNINGQPVAYYDFDRKVTDITRNAQQIVPSDGFTKYGDISYNKGNIIGKRFRDGISYVYLWGYNNTYPVAEVLGTDLSTVTPLVDQYVLDNSNGQYTDQRIRDEINKVRNAAGGNNYMVTSYTFDPLVGMTSKVDANGRATYYEYDGMNRLQVIRDHNNNVLRKYCYNYFGQPEDCGQTNTIFTNNEKSGNFQKYSCPAGTISNSVVYTVPAGKYTSGISQADADQKALDDITANGKNYADSNAICMYNLSIVVAAGGIQPDQFVLLVKNSKGNVLYQGTFYAGGNNVLPFSRAFISDSSYIVEVASNQAMIAVVNGVEKNVQSTQTWPVKGNITVAVSKVHVFYNIFKSAPFTRTCDAGYTSETVYYSVAAAKYSSLVSQADADQQAQNDINANGQAYANANAKCIPGNVSIVLKNSFAGSNFPPVTISFIKDGNITDTYTFPTTSNGNKTVTVPIGTYRLRFSVPAGFANMVFQYSIDKPVQSWSNNSTGIVNTGDIILNINTSYTIKAGNNE